MVVLILKIFKSTLYFTYKRTWPHVCTTQIVIDIPVQCTVNLQRLNNIMLIYYNIK